MAKVRYYRFTSLLGEIYAATTFVDQKLHIGFSFCNPEDIRKQRKLRTNCGRGIALSRLTKDPIIVDDPLMDWGTVRPRIVKYLIESADGDIFERLHVKPFRGKGSGYFISWFRVFVYHELYKKFRDEYHEVNSKRKGGI